MKIIEPPHLEFDKLFFFSRCHKLDEVIGLGVTCGAYIFTHFVAK
jgi:hypothetical protein